ncbi:MAG: alpha/beta fold hydrolase [Chthoniobacteraceae bacterium]
MVLVALIAGTLARFDAAPIAPDPARPPVLLVHGIFSTARDMERLARHLRSRGHEVHVPTLTPNGGQAPLEDLARQLAQYAEREFRGRRFDLVGFSMGGLVSRYYLQRLGGGDRVNRFVTLAAPHHGTRMARLGKLPGWVQMRPGSEFLDDLARDADSLRGIPFTSFYTPLDTIIVPARSSEMPQARNVRIWAVMHPSLILEMRCIRAVAHALR